MRIPVLKRLCLSRWLVLMVMCGLMLALAVAATRAQEQTQSTATPKTPRAVGTIKSISGNTLTLATSSGPDVKVQLPAEVKVFRVPPGSKDLKEATPMQLSDLQPGDRILVRGNPGQDAASLVAITIVAMKKADISQKQATEQEEWQRHGIGGLVSSVDAANNAITIQVLTATGRKDVVIHAGKSTVLRRYAPGSVKFDEAKLAPMSEVKVGDQVHARGSRSADGSEFAADEIVSGFFRNIAGTILAVNASAGTLTVSDLDTKKPVELKVTADAQMRNVPQAMAQRIAMRLKGNGTETNGGNGTAGPPSQQGGARPAGGDTQQMLSRLPVSPLSDFQKGDVVMIVAAGGQAEGQFKVITLLGGVEPILRASSQEQAASILSPWSLSEGGGGDMGTN